jgi:phosphohistidine phosphatase
MKNLILIRHAKSSWDVPLKDIDRQLNHRGIKDAHLVAAKGIEYVPNTFLMKSSPAKRASETAIVFAHTLMYPIENIEFLDKLYTFDDSKLESVIKAFENDYDNVILFGHNAAITNFVNRFGDVFIENVPTAGFVSIEFDTNDWKTIDKGKIKKIIIPKDLK